MNIDMTVPCDKGLINIRVGAIILKDGKFLMVGNNIRPEYLYSVGGRIKFGETAEEAVIREVYEETGLTVHSLKCNGEVLFINNDYQEMMYVYEITDFSGELKDCNEGELKWITIKDMYSLPMWEGDKAYLPLLGKEEPYFRLKIVYKDKELVSVNQY